MINRDKALGAYIGAAIGDAMGGPVEGQHAARITKYYGRIDGLLPYGNPPDLATLHPGGALHSEPGSITDDTYIRADMTRFFLATRAPRTPAMLAEYMLKHADFSMWWPPAVEALKRIERGEATPENGGMTHVQGGGIGWWTPVGILHGGRPVEAAVTARSLCRIWKAPVEQDILAGVQAGLAEAMRPGADFESVAAAVLRQCRPEAASYLRRGVDIGRNAQTHEDLWRTLYAQCLIDVVTLKPDVPIPSVRTFLPYADDKYISCLFVEQMALALAAFVFSKGDPRTAIPNCVMIGRDCDSTATTVGSWVGALHGLAALPEEWVATVLEANRVDCDVRGLGERLIAIAE